MIGGEDDRLCTQYAEMRVKTRSTSDGASSALAIATSKSEASARKQKEKVLETQERRDIYEVLPADVACEQ